jgi:hypothetical protein
MEKGSMPNDNGYLSNISKDEVASIQGSDEVAARYLRRLVGARELIHNESRYCLWLVDVEPSDLRTSPVIRERVKEVKSFREKSTREATQRLSKVPNLFGEIRQPNEEFIAIPRITSSSRDYVPLARLDAKVIINDKVSSVSTPDRFPFGILMSGVFNSWNKAISGRTRNDTLISIGITYNNFPWPTPTDGQREVIENAAQGVLDPRELHPCSSLANLYDPLSMPPDLLKAHKALDKAVLSAYGLPAGATDTEILAELFKRYEALTKGDQLPLPAKKTVRKPAAKKV